jgi:hypothetical protein
MCGERREGPQAVSAIGRRQAERQAGRVGHAAV